MEMEVDSLIKELKQDDGNIRAAAVENLGTVSMAV